MKRNEKQGENKEDEEKQNKIKAHEHITAVLHVIKDSSGKPFLKVAKKLPTVGAVKKYLKLKRVNKKNNLQVWTEIESKLPTVDVAPEEDLLGPVPTLDM